MNTESARNNLSDQEIQRTIAALSRRTLLLNPASINDSPRIRMKRLAGYKSAVVRGVVGDSKFGHFLMGHRMVNARKRKLGW